MGTFCTIHIKSNDKGAVVSEFERYLAETHRGQVVQTTVAETFGKLYGDEFLCSNKPPTKFAAICEQPGWVTAHFNSFCRLREFAAEVSGTLKTFVITAIAQTCSSAYMLSICEAGRHVRTLEFADGEWIKQDGRLLPFESEPLGKNIAEPGEEPLYVFEGDSVKEYCEHFGLKFWSNDWFEMEKPEFTIVQVLPARVYGVQEREQG